MKLLTIIFSVLFSCSVYAQHSMFVRVYDLSGKKIHVGHVFAITDSSLQLKTIENQKINVTEIGYIKTKRSAINSIAIGSLIGASTLAIAGAASADPNATWFSYSEGEGAAAGTLVGLPLGAAVAGLTLPFKKPKTYIISGDVIKWKVFQSVVSNTFNKKS